MKEGFCFVFFQSNYRTKKLTTNRNDINLLYMRTKYLKRQRRISYSSLTPMAPPTSTLSSDNVPTPALKQFSYLLSIRNSSIFLATYIAGVGMLRTNTPETDDNMNQ